MGWPGVRAVTNAKRKREAAQWRRLAQRLVQRDTREGAVWCGEGKPLYLAHGLCISARKFDSWRAARKLLCPNNDDDGYWWSDAERPCRYDERDDFEGRILACYLIAAMIDAGDL